MKDRIFKSSSVRASVIFQIPWIRWFHWISGPFRENTNFLFNAWFIFTFVLCGNNRFVITAKTISLKLCLFIDYGCMDVKVKLFKYEQTGPFTSDVFLWKSEREYVLDTYAPRVGTSVLCLHSYTFWKVRLRTEIYIRVLRPEPHSVRPTNFVHIYWIKLEKLCLTSGIKK